MVTDILRFLAEMASGPACRQAGNPSKEQGHALINS